MIKEEIRNELFMLRDKKYRDFQSKLIPTLAGNVFIGVRTPDLKAMATRFGKRDDIGAFLEDLPHEYFDENQLHAFIISGIRNYELCIEKVKKFLPYVDNWATCDQMSPKIFKKHTDELIGQIKKWICSDETYTVRFGIGMLMQYYLDDNFDTEYPKMVAAVSSDEYYVNMMIAWYFATALAKQYDSILSFLEEDRLDKWIHNKAIQKSVESRRITDEQKAYLKSLRK